jgi:hypothetical protein
MTTDDQRRQQFALLRCCDARASACGRSRAGSGGRSRPLMPLSTATSRSGSLVRRPRWRARGWLPAAGCAMSSHPTTSRSTSCSIRRRFSCRPPSTRASRCRRWRRWPRARRSCVRCARQPRLLCGRRQLSDARGERRCCQRRDSAAARRSGAARAAKIAARWLTSNAEAPNESDNRTFTVLESVAHG